MAEEFNFDPMTGERIAQSGAPAFDPMTGERIAQSGAPAFDPMTGERIAQSGAPAFDPMTGERIAQSGAPAFDPMTGERITQSGAPAFDPMTGERIVQSGAPTFDPMTGERIAQSGAPAFDPMTGRQIVGNKPTGKKKVLPIVLGIVGVALILVCGIFGLVASGVFSSNTGKVLSATRKTAKNAEFLGLEEIAEIVADNSYSVQSKMDISDQNVEITYSNTDKQKAVDLSADISGFGNINGKMVLSENSLDIAIPFLTDKILHYNYKEKKYGAIADLQNGDVADTLDAILNIMYTSGVQGKAEKNMEKATLEQMRNIKFEKTSNGSYEIDGKERKCKGYKTTLTDDDFEAYIDIMENYYREKFSDVDMDEYLKEMEDAFDELKESVKDIDDLDITVYLYKGKLAAVNAKIDTTEMEIQFNNSKNPLQKITIPVNVGGVEDVLVWEGVENGSRIVYTVEVSGEEEPFVLSYDKKSGEFALEIDDDLELEGSVKKKSGSITYTVDRMMVDGEKIDIQGEYTISDKTEKITVSGDTFDIGNASEEELTDFLDDIEEELKDLLGDVEDVLEDAF